jgi:hypothetical protein
MRIELKPSAIWKNNGRKALGFEVGSKDANRHATKEGVLPLYEMELLRDRMEAYFGIEKR